MRYLKVFMTMSLVFLLCVMLPMPVYAANNDNGTETVTTNTSKEQKELDKKAEKEAKKESKAEEKKAKSEEKAKKKEIKEKYAPQSELENKVKIQFVVKNSKFSFNSDKNLFNLGNFISCLKRSSFILL